MDASPKHNADAIAQHLLSFHLTLSVAESMTDGYINGIFSSLPLAEYFYQGGITLTNLGENTRRKKVVSENMAIAMAKQTTELFSSSVGLSLAASKKDRHIAYCALVVDDKILFTKRLRSSMRDSADIRRFYGHQVLKWVLLSLKKNSI